MYFCLGFVFGGIFSKGGYSALVPLKKVVAFAGGNAILSCSLKIPLTDHIPTVEWSKEGLNSNIVFLYRDGCETFEMKNPAFEFRTSLFMTEVKNGNISLRISNVRPSDAGTYQCLIIQKDGTRETTKVELVVVSDPKLEVVFVENEGSTVACRASCWLPAPLIKILDDKGNYITDKEPNQEEDSRGCKTTRQTFFMLDSTRRVVCRVSLSEKDQNRTAEIFFSVSCTGFNFKICCIVGVISTVLLLFGISVYIWKTRCKNAIGKKLKGRNSSDSALTGVSCDNLSLLTNRAENTRNMIIEDLEKEIADLKLVISSRDETICQRDETIRQRDETIRQRDETIRSRGAFYPHDKSTTIQSSSEFLRGSLLGRPNQPLDLNTKTAKIPGDHNLNKKPSEHAKPIHQKQNSNLSPGRVSKKKSSQSIITEIMNSNASRFAADNKKKRNVHPVSDPSINPGHSGGLVHRRNSSWPSLYSQSGNRYTPLADLPEQ